MKLLRIVFLLLCATKLVQAQTDRTNKSIPVVVPLKEAPEESVSHSVSLPLSNKKENSSPKGVDFTGKSRYVNRYVDFRPNYGIFKELHREDYKAPIGDQFFGELTQKGDFVYVYCRDHEAIDGDRISILVNGKVEVQDVFLLGYFRGFQIHLSVGFNKIEFLALNQGESGPNTAEFQVVDQEGNLLKSERWNLGTGYKAGFVVVKSAGESSVQK